MATRTGASGLGDGVTGTAKERAMTTADVIALTIGESAYRRIRSDIIFGRIPPGRKLRLDRMKAEYGASISTLREILNRLAAEGFVVAEGQRGFEVPPVTAQNLRELAALRLLLEGHAHGAVLRRRRHGMGGADRRGASQARPDGAAHARRRPQRNRGLEALRLGIPSGADFRLRLARADAVARGGLRQVPALPDDRAQLPRRGRGAGAPGAPRCGARPRRRGGGGDPEGPCRWRRRPHARAPAPSAGRCRRQGSAGGRACTGASHDRRTRA